jgi:nucleoside-diphosphate kinase
LTWTGVSFILNGVFHGVGKFKAMAIERTLSILKPDAVRRNLIGTIIARFEEKGMKPVSLRMQHLTKDEAEVFYYVHKRQPFFDSLVAFMSSGPVVVLVLQGEGVIAGYRALMGATDPKKAEAGTLRGDYGTSIEENVVHGSDSQATAAFEVPFFFPDLSGKPSGPA